MFWIAVINNPSQAPLDLGGKGSSNGLGLDYVSVATGSEGTPWAGFWDDCGATVPQSIAGCPPGRRPPPGARFGYADYAWRLAISPGLPRRRRES